MHKLNGLQKGDEVAVADITGVLGGVLFEVGTDMPQQRLNTTLGQVTKEKNETRVQRFLAVTRERVLVMKYPDDAGGDQDTQVSSHG